MHDVKIVNYATLIMNFIYSNHNSGKIDFVKKIPPSTASFQAMEASK